MRSILTVIVEQCRRSPRAPSRHTNPTRKRSPLLTIALLAGCFLWVYWPTISELVRRWSSDAKYSHGYLVPVFAGYLLWARRGQRGKVAWQPNWWGIVLLIAGLALRFAGTYLFLPWFGDISLLPVVAGLFLLLGGWPALVWAGPAVAFLVFMIPLPFRAEQALSYPLQRLGTVASVYALQTIGLAAHARGNIIVIKQHLIGVAEACNGLSMLVIFFALSTAVVLLIRRPLLDKLVILISAIPIAIICNLTRITVTGLLHVTVGRKWADLVFHDLAGWLMMPMALGLLWLELKIMAWIMVERKSSGPAPRGLNLGLLQGGMGTPKTAPTREKVDAPMLPSR